MSTELEGKVALVTGGSRGLGAEMVRAFAAEGAHVAIASRKLASCEELAAEVSARHGVRALPVACNVSHWDECDALAEAVYAEFGAVDVLVNNAGLSPLYPSLDQVTEELFDKVIGVNLRGPFRLAALIGTRMAEGDGGAIINIGSIEAIRPQPGALPYAAAKAGLHVLSEGLRTVPDFVSEREQTRVFTECGPLPGRAPGLTGPGRRRRCGWRRAGPGVSACKIMFYVQQ